MYKRLGWVVVLLLLVAGLQAQKKYLFEDTSTTVVEEPPKADMNNVAAPVAEDDEDIAAPETDTTLFHFVRAVQKDTVERWKNMDELAYARYLDSLLRTRQLTIEEKQQREQENGSRSKKQREVSSAAPEEISYRFSASPVVNLIFWILAIAFIGFILYSLFLRDGVFKQSGKKAMAKQDKDPGLLDITVPLSEIDRKILDAVAAKHYRLAVRYQYIKSLQQLSVKQLISFAADKTNIQYVNEIANTDLRNTFARLTLHYEYVWYGEFPIDEMMYRRIEQQFDDFYAKL